MAELMFQDDELIVSKTDTQGKILYGNELFLKLAGYTEQELLNSPHNIIRHPKMPRVIFKLLWETVQQGKEINAYVMNRAKNGDHYWVLANVTPSYDANQNIVGFYSVRRKPTNKALDVIIPLYERLYQAEKSGGVSASQKILDAVIAENGGRYDRFILSL
ncbi:PAS domain-containing protein [Sulfurimonas marina]|uniref:PAS domain-containing protein n=1 Tax=Sulfurimonas marina TaxID=2590551 RepID=A0A7M3V9I6_9BACT|nr:PAS domain-containing protein [Sulfurimonas marina]QOP40419.1 PAS domain-containing protein [Sulfurimonas marina]